MESLHRRNRQICNQQKKIVREQKQNISNEKNYKGKHKIQRMNPRYSRKCVVFDEKVFWYLLENWSAFRSKIKQTNRKNDKHHIHTKWPLVFPPSDYVRYFTMKLWVRAQWHVLNKIINFKLKWKWKKKIRNPRFRHRIWNLTTQQNLSIEKCLQREQVSVRARSHTANCK